MRHLYSLIGSDCTLFCDVLTYPLRKLFVSVVLIVMRPIQCCSLIVRGELSCAASVRRISQIFMDLGEIGSSHIINQEPKRDVSALINDEGFQSLYGSIRELRENKILDVL